MQSPIDAFAGIYLLTYFWFYELKLEMYKSANWEKDTIFQIIILVLSKVLLQDLSIQILSSIFEPWFELSKIRILCRKCQLQIQTRFEFDLISIRIRFNDESN